MTGFCGVDVGPAVAGEIATALVPVGAIVEVGFIVANHKAPIRGSQIYLRLRLVGNTYTGYFSEDGVNWITLGEHTRDFSQARVGLMAAQAAQAIPASFDFFTITRLQQ